MISPLMQPNFFPRICTDKLKNMTKENLDSSPKSWDVQRCYAYVARGNADMMLPRTKLSSVGKTSINLCWNTAAMDTCTSTAASLMKNLILRQQLEFSAQTITLLLHMNKYGKDSPTFIKKNCRVMEFTLNLLLSRFFICLNQKCLLFVGIYFF